MTVHFPFQNTYAALPATFFARVAPTPVASPRLIKLNRPLAIQLGLDPDMLSTPEGTEILAGKTLPAGADPIAMAYAGHQFGQFVPQLGDARCGIDPRRRQPHPRRHLPIFCGARRYRGRAAARGPRDRAALSTSSQCGAALSCTAGRRRRTPGRPRGTLAPGRLHPRRDEY